MATTDGQQGQRIPIRPPEGYKRTHGPYTPQQLRFLELLSDGMRHQTKVFQELLWDEETLNKEQAVARVVCDLRDKLESSGQTIVCEVYQGRHWYRHIRLLRASE